jgi:hypothetical protein
MCGIIFALACNIKLGCCQTPGAPTQKHNMQVIEFGIILNKSEDFRINAHGAELWFLYFFNVFV